MKVAKVSFDQVAITEGSRYSVEASTLGLKPGEWPAYITTDIGNGEPFMRFRKFRIHPVTGEVLGLNYIQSPHSSITLFVIND